MVDTANQLLKFVRFTEVKEWDTKCFLNSVVSSQYSVDKLGDYLNHQTKKIKLYNYPDKCFGILGISNKEGMFDAYSKYGKEINQPYIAVKDGYLAYNPYRVNVGSIGLKTSDLRNEYISPAYVVFSCKKTVFPEYLFLLMKTSVFNKLIRENTTGSVRQALSFKRLKEIKAPIPDLNEQKRLVEKYNATNAMAEMAETEAQQLQNSIYNIFDNALGTVEKKATINSGLNIVSFSKLYQWGVELLLKDKIIRNKRYRIFKVNDICDVGSGGTPSRRNSEYYTGSIPWIKTAEVLDDVIIDTEEKISQKAIEESSAKLYMAGSIIIAMYGQGATRGRTAKLGVEATTNQACAVLYNINENIVLKDYLWFYFQSEYFRLRALASGNNQPNLNAQIIKSYPVVVPPITSNDPNEITQEKIVFHIFEVKDKIKTLCQQVESLRKLAKQEFENAVFGEL